MRRKPLGFAKDQGAVRPRAGIADIEVIAPAFGDKAASADRQRHPIGPIGGDPVAPMGLAALETPVAAFDIVPFIVSFAVDQNSNHLLLRSGFYESFATMPEKETSSGVPTPERSRIGAHSHALRARPAAS